MTADTTHTHHLPRPGDTIRVTGVMPDDPDPMLIGSSGIVTEVNPEVRQIHVDWHDGRRLILVATDPFEIVDPADWSQR